MKDGNRIFRNQIFNLQGSGFTTHVEYTVTTECLLIGWDTGFGLNPEPSLPMVSNGKTCFRIGASTGNSITFFFGSTDSECEFRLLKYYDLCIRCSAS